MCIQLQIPFLFMQIDKKKRAQFGAVNLSWTKDIELMAGNIMFIYLIVSVRIWFLQAQDFGDSCGPSCDEVSPWSGWSACSPRCGSYRTQTRTRYRTSRPDCQMRCPVSLFLRDSRQCDTNGCHNGGTPFYDGCSCKPGWTGTCCDQSM